MAWDYEAPEKVRQEFDFVYRGYRYQFTGLLSTIGEWVEDGLPALEVEFFSEGKVTRTKVESEYWEAGKTYRPVYDTEIQRMFRVYEVDDKNSAFGVIESESGSIFSSNREAENRVNWEEVRDDED